MKQVTQRLRDGRIELLDVPIPELRPEGVLVDTRASLLSAGTERTKVVTGRQNLVSKARARPDDVRRVVDKARRDGLRETLDAVRLRLDQPGALGYSSSGVVIAAGARVRDLNVGDRVACGGANYASHADVNYVPANLCVRLPESVSFEAGAFTTVGSIALHGVRQADARIGERIAVIGLGLVGQLAGQILRAGGCFVLGVDLDAQTAARAMETGAVDRSFVRSELDEFMLPPEFGSCDAILITAATKSSDPLALAAALARDRAKVVVVGDVALELVRSRWYEKELDLRLSRSYGPGRYDLEYEERGLDYPVGYVRWTERRNMEAFVELMALKKIDVARLVSTSVELDDAPIAYDRLTEGTASTLGILLRYKPTVETQPLGQLPPLSDTRSSEDKASPLLPTSVGMIGAGSFAQRLLIPSLREAGFKLAVIASATGLSAASARERFGFERVASADGVITDPRVGVVVIATRHGSHATLAERALRAGKHVFVEKPPAISLEQLVQLRQARHDTGRLVAVGFNRRHAPLAQRMRDHLGPRRGPMELLYRINAEALPAGHWLDELDEGGGRLIGEACHFIDFACWMAGAVPGRVSCTMAVNRSEPIAAARRFSIILSFPDGSIATVLYATEGARGVPKEYVEAHADGRSALLSDFRRLTLCRADHKKTLRVHRQDKGHRDQATCLRRVLADHSLRFPSPDPLDTMAVTFAALRSGETSCPVLCHSVPEPSDPGLSGSSD